MSVVKTTNNCLCVAGIISYSKCAVPAQYKKNQIDTKCLQHVLKPAWWAYFSGLCVHTIIFILSPLFSYRSRYSWIFVFNTTARSKMRANIWVHYDLNVAFLCLRVKIPNYHQYVFLYDIIEDGKYILSNVCLRRIPFVQLSLMQYLLRCVLSSLIPFWRFW